MHRLHEASTQLSGKVPHEKQADDSLGSLSASMVQILASLLDVVDEMNGKADTSSNTAKLVKELDESLRSSISTAQRLHGQSQPGGPRDTQSKLG